MSTNGATAHYVLPHNLDAEASILGGIILLNSVLSRVETLEVDDFYDHKHKVVFQGIRNVAHSGRPIDIVTLEAEIERDGKLAAIGGVGFLGELTLRVPTADNVEHYAQIVQQHSRNRRVVVELSSALERCKRGIYEPDELLLETIGELQRLNAEAPAGKRSAPWLRGPQLVDEILRYAGEPWISLMLAQDELARVRGGGIVVIMGGSGSGKSSLTSGLLVEHARNVGPAIALSIELPAEEFGGRIVGMRCDASWEEALRGMVRREFMEDALDLPRLYVIDQDNATVANLSRTIDQAKIDYPGQPILVAIDYAQLMESKEREVRMRVADAFKQINAVARRKRVVAIAVSQMSRASAQAATSGEKLGAQSADGGAESAAIERYASVTLSIGSMSEPRSDGSRAVELSLGKGRMMGGDRVYPMIYWGRSGRWRVADVARPAAEIRAARDTERNAKAQASLELSLLGAASKATGPLSRDDLSEQVQGRTTSKRSAIACLVARGDLVEVQQRKLRSKSWNVATPEKAAEWGVSLVRDMEPRDA